eukprot:6873432-Prymnesium_polylepis.1
MNSTPGSCSKTTAGKPSTCMHVQGGISVVVEAESEPEHDEAAPDAADVPAGIFESSDTEPS